MVSFIAELAMVWSYRDAEMIICIPTIRHSGTRLICKKVFAGWKLANPIKPIIKGGNHIIAGHVYEPSLEYMIKYASKYPSIVPLRHPVRIWKSFVDRELGYDYYYDHWMNMAKRISGFNPTYVHIDRPSIRDIELNKFEGRIGMALKHDWSTDSSVSDNGNEDYLISHYELQKIPDVIMKFYESTFL